MVRLTALAVPALAAVALLASGCRVEDAQQEAARETVQGRLAGDERYVEGDVHCTGAASPWFVEEETSVFFCTARLRTGRCDVYRVDAAGSGVTVRLEERGTSCTPPG